MAKRRYFYWDYETPLIAPGLQAPPPVSLQFAWGAGPVKILHCNFDYHAAQRTVYKALSDPDVHLVAHRTAYEWLVTAAWRTDWLPLLSSADLAGRIHCTQARDKLIRIARGQSEGKYNLEASAEYYGLKVKPDKSFEGRMRYGELWDVPVRDWTKPYIDYAAFDVEVCRELFWAQEAANKKNCLCMEPVTVSAQITLALTSAWGMETDIELATVLYDETVKRLEKNQVLLQQHGLIRPKRDKGVMRLSRNKKRAEEVITEAYALLGRTPPRTAPTPTGIKKAYIAAGLPVPPIPKKPSKSDIDEVREVCGDEHLDGNISLDKEACQNAGNGKPNEDGSPSPSQLMQMYSDFGQATTLLSKLKILQKPLIQPSYNEVVNTGRTSCRQGQRPDPGQHWTAAGAQVQNMPRDGVKFVDSFGIERKWGVRETFVAHGYRDWLAQGGNPAERLRSGDLPPNCLITCDYAAHEMRVWSWHCYTLFGFSDLRLILNDLDRCPHIEMGCEIEGLSVKEGYALRKSSSKEDKARLKALRNIAKGPNFGLPGGMGPARLQDYCRVGYGVDLEFDVAKRIAKVVWPRTYREARLWLEHWSEVTKKGAADIVQEGTGMVRGGVTYCAAANGGFQGPAAFIAKKAGARARHEAYCVPSSPLYGFRPYIFVHDEWGYVGPTHKAAAAGHRLATIMREEGEAFCKGVLFPVDAALSFRYSKMYGDPVYSPDKELVPYELAEASGWLKAA